MKVFKDCHNLDLIFSGACNMKCEYCYIHKHPDRMREYNKEIQDALASGDYAKNVIDTFHDYKDEITHFGFWGAEPTLNAKYFKDLIVPLWDFFTECHSVMFSTNALLGMPAIKQFIDTVYDYAVKTQSARELEIQFSIDGPPYLNDASRHVGATENTVKVIYETMEYVAELVKMTPYFHFRGNVKATLSARWIRYLTENNDKLIEWFDYFENIQTKAEEIIGGGHPQIEIFFANYPTLVDPGEHTKEDGQQLTKFIKALSKLDVGRWKHYYHPLYPQLLRSYNDYERHIHEKHQPLYQPGIYSCSAGNNGYSTDYRGKIMTCHRLFDNAYMGMNKHSELFIEKTSTILDQSQEKIDDKIAQLAYTDKLFHGWSGTLARRYFLGYVLRGLVICGDLPESVLDPDYIKVLFACIGGLSCHYGQLDMTGSVYVMTRSYINLLANGAAEMIWGYYAAANDLNMRQKGETNEPTIVGERLMGDF